MSMRIREAAVARVLDDGGYAASVWDRQAEDWDPGYHTAQRARVVHVFHDGPGEAEQLALYEAELRAAGYHVHATQQPGGGRRRLEVTRP